LQATKTAFSDQTKNRARGSEIFFSGQLSGSASQRPVLLAKPIFGAHPFEGVTEQTA
jgi:hypothetical protein